MKRLLQPFGNSTVRLRLITEADLPVTLDWRNREDVRVWFKTSQIITMDQHREWFAQYASRDDDFLFVVEAIGRPVAQASVYRIDWDEKTAEVGRFIVAPGAGGLGYVRLACAELLRFCAFTFNLKSVFLEVKEDNTRAIRLYERNGFREVGKSHGLIRMSLPLAQIIEGEIYREGYASWASTPER
jgi:diamine N-acetyltransferase